MKMKQEDFNVLSQALGENQAEELKKLVQNYDKYIKKFKKSVNDIISPMGMNAYTYVKFDTINKEN